MPVSTDYPFVLREESYEHLSAIRNIKGAKRATNVKSAIELVFCHHKAVFRNLECRLISSDKASECKGFRMDINSCQYERAICFYKNFYHIPKIKKGVSRDGEDVTLTEFLDRITHFNDNGTNKLTFLLGNVGWGKTAFINYLLTTYGRDWFFEKNIFFLRIDIHSGGGGNISSYSEIIDKMFSKFRQVLRYPEVEEKINSMCQHFTGYDKLVDYSLKLGKKEQELASVFSELKNIGFQILLIIDNIDQIYHRDDRKRFIHIDLPIDHDSIQPITKIITAFFHDNIELGALGLNVIFSLRNETYNIVSQTVEYIFNPDRITRYNCNAYTLGNVDWKEVVSDRLKFLEELSIKCNLAPGRHKDIMEVILPIKNDILEEKSTDTLVSNLSRVASFGLRCIIDFFAQYSWINNDRHVIERYFHQVHVGLLAYMLNGYRRFSQERGRFPNLYLINSHTVEHPPTYWLKRLLTEYFYKNKIRNLESTLKTTLSIFAQGDGTYPEDIVLETLGNLSEIHESNTCKPIIRISDCKKYLIPDAIKLTMRGRHLLENLHHKFIYLQLIVDDYRMPYPSTLVDYFTYGDIDYGYLVFQNTDYHKSVLKMIRHKANIVNNFIELLSVSLEYEKKKYYNTWDKLNRLGVGVDVEELRNSFYEEIKKISDFTKAGIDIQNLKDSAAAINAKITLFYKENFNVPDKSRKKSK